MDIFKNDEIYTINEVAERLKVHPQTIRNKVKRGEFVPHVIGKRDAKRKSMRFMGCELNKYLGKREGEQGKMSE